jgi:hypothetical protein
MFQALTEVSVSRDVDKNARGTVSATATAPDIALRNLKELD